jgi:hypothetical protein
VAARDNNRDLVKSCGSVVIFFGSGSDFEGGFGSRSGPPR